VVAVDNDREVLSIWAPICPAKVLQISRTFGRLVPDEIGTFDMVWMGNGHHYMHKEDPMGWVGRLAKLATDRILVEGPTGRNASGFGEWIPGTVPEESEWLEKAAWFGMRLQGWLPSPSYTPGRAIWYLNKTN